MTVSGLCALSVVFLAAGPAIGVLAMWRLRISPVAKKLAGGRV